MSSEKTLRICERGHKYYKSSDCPTCPTCESQKKPQAEFLSKISAPARRAFDRNEIANLKNLAEYSEKEVLEFHGVGPSSIPILKESLKSENLYFRKDSQ